MTAISCQACPGTLLVLSYRPSRPGYFDPWDGGHPPEGAEVELDTCDRCGREPEEEDFDRAVEAAAAAEGEE